MASLKISIEVFLEELKVQGAAAGTVTLYRGHLGSLEKSLKRRRSVARVEPADLERWVRRLYREGNSVGVRRGRILLVKRFFKWLKERAEILSDPAARLEVPRKEDRLLKRPPNAKSVDRLLKKMPSGKPMEHRNRAMVDVLYGCMLRVSELVSLNISDVDLDERFLIVRKGKGGRGRALPMPERTAKLLRIYLRVRKVLPVGGKAGIDARNALFLSKRGRRMETQAVRERIGHIGRQAGIKGLHPHLFRHAGAVHMLRGKADIRHVQEMLGHVEPETTKEYLRLVPSDLKKAYDEAFPVLEV